MQKSKTSNRIKNTSAKRISPTDIESIVHYANIIDIKENTSILKIQMTTL